MKYILFIIIILSGLSLFAENPATRDRLVILPFKSFIDNNPKLALAISENFITGVVETRQYQVIERIQLNDIMNELKLQNSDEFTSSNIIQIGRLAQAKMVVIGSVSRIGSVITVNIRSVNIETGEIGYARSFTSEEASLFKKIKRLALIFSYNLNEENSADMAKLDKITEDFFKTRNFFDIGLGGGAFFNYNTESHWGYPAETLIGGVITLTFGYQYAFTRYFAFGPGATIVLPLSGYQTKYKEGDPSKFMNYYNHLKFTGGSFLLSFLFGDLEQSKLGFSLDIGGAWWAAAKIGFFANGFTFKLGYSLTGLPELSFDTLEKAQPPAYCNNISMEFGYKFNWKAAD
jgi:TolB-like protein